MSISASIALCTYHLPGFVEQIREKFPELSVDVHASDGTADLIGNQANIAIRHVEPKDQDLVVRRAAGVSAGLFARADIAESYELCIADNKFADLPFVGYGNVDASLMYYANVGLQLSEQNIACTSNVGVLDLKRSNAVLELG